MTPIPINDIARFVSCAAQLGTEGCGYEQSLKASIKALNQPSQADFVRDNHLLAVMIISDEEDCSIEDPAVFSTPEWQGEDRNLACNYPETNESDLFDTQYFYDALMKLKGGNEHQLLFAAVVGVPTDAQTHCQGFGNALTGCLESDEMTYKRKRFTIETDPGVTVDYIHFAPACTRTDSDGNIVTEARPGRRYVQLATRFGCAGYVYSICNDDWSPAMREITKRIAHCLSMAD